jgi:hypothetical protein
VNVSLHRVDLTVTPDHAAKLLEGTNGLYFDWSSDTRRYHAHIRPRPRPKPVLSDLLFDATK